MNDITDDEVSNQLAGQYVKGPRQWRGKTLAPLSRGLWDVLRKVVKYTKDTNLFHDVALLHILEIAHADTEEGKLAARRAVIMSTDDIETFRAEVTLIIDTLSDAEEEEATRIVDEILNAINKAVVVSTEKKNSDAAQEQPPTKTPSPSGSSPALQDGASTTSAGS